MDFEDEQLDRDVDHIINQIKNQGKSLKTVEKDKPNIQKEDLEKFVIDNASTIIQDSIEMVQSLKPDVMAGADPRLVESVSELVKAVTGAIDSLSKLKLSDDKIKSQKELKMLELENKEEENKSGLYLSREEIMKALFTKKEPEKLQPPTYDV